MTKLQVYYWPFLARNASIIRLLDYKSIDYEWIKSKAEMSSICSTWGATNDTFAPPVVVDDTTQISQQVAATMYVASKYGVTGTVGADPSKILQYCLDIIDVFENGWGKNNEDGPTLKAWVNGDRCHKLMSNIERSIKGPFYCGDEPCAADFLLLGHLDWRQKMFEQIQDKSGVDVLASFPKMAGVVAKLRGDASYKKGYPVPGGLKDEIISAYDD